MREYVTAVRCWRQRDCLCCCMLLLLSSNTSYSPIGHVKAHEKNTNTLFDPFIAKL
jgi:hypothetical protein